MPKVMFPEYYIKPKKIFPEDGVYKTIKRRKNFHLKKYAAL